MEPMKLRRSVGAEVNWGIRFTCEADADTFLDGLAGTFPTGNPQACRSRTRRTKSQQKPVSAVASSSAAA